jgi:hypothetical protein
MLINSILLTKYPTPKAMTKLLYLPLLICNKNPTEILILLFNTL